jgi:hypothetical protein
MHRTITTGVLAALLALSACSLDRENPNSPTQDQTFSSPDGIIALGIGVQNRFGLAEGSFIYSAGLLTEELGAVSAALVTISDAESGVAPFGAGFVQSSWQNAFATLKTADDIIVNAPNVTLDPGTLSGVMALAYTLKAGSLGQLVQQFKEMPIETYETSTPTFETRTTVLARIAALLDSAETTLTATPPSSQFTTTILSRGFDLPNTIRTWRARYRRIAGDNQGAINAANTVARNVFSTLSYTNDQVPNPLWNLSAGSSGVLPRDSWRLSITGTDGRVPYHVIVAAITGRIGTPLDNWTRYPTALTNLPTYYTDEALLIKAEALANLDQLAGAQAVLDSVRTDCTGQRASGDPKPCLAPIAGQLSKAALLDSIYNNRRIELYSTGLRWEDARRLNIVGAGAPAKRCWLPYPIAERNANPANVPPDPEGTEPPVAPARCF